MIRLWDFKEETLTKALDIIRKGEPADEFLGHLYIGDLSIEFKLLGEPAEITFDVYVGGIDSGYGYTQKNQMPYDYADGGSICNGGNSSLFSSFDAFKIIAEYRILEFIRDNKVLMDKATAPKITMDWVPDSIAKTHPELFADAVVSSCSDKEFNDLVAVCDQVFDFRDFSVAFGEVISEATFEEDNDYKEIGQHVYLLLENNKDNPDVLKAIKDTVIAISGWSIGTLTERLKRNLNLEEKAGIDELIEDGKVLADSINKNDEQLTEETKIQPEINQKKLKAYLAADMIMEFNSDKECMEYFNTYDSQNFQTVEEMQAYQGKYGFGIDGKWYHISYDEALDVWEASKETHKDKGRLMEGLKTTVMKSNNHIGGKHTSIER